MGGDTKEMFLEHQGKYKLQKHLHIIPAGIYYHREREADLESFLNNLYSQSDMSAAAGAGPTTAHTEGLGASATRNRKKNKRKK